MAAGVNRRGRLKESIENEVDGRVERVLGIPRAHQGLYVSLNDGLILCERYGLSELMENLKGRTPDVQAMHESRHIRQHRCPAAVGCCYALEPVDVSRALGSRGSTYFALLPSTKDRRQYGRSWTFRRIPAANIWKPNDNTIIFDHQSL